MGWSFFSSCLDPKYLIMLRTAQAPRAAPKSQENHIYLYGAMAKVARNIYQQPLANVPSRNPRYLYTSSCLILE